MRAALLAAGLVAALAGPFRPGVADGRAGVRALADGDSSAAATAFQSGLAASPPRDVHARLAFDLGLAVFGTDAVQADSLFIAAATHADRAPLRALAARHAGLAALADGDAPRAVGHLRRALLLDPADADARRAYAIARRQADGPGAPTPEALRIKAEADRLVAERRYSEALALVQRERARVPSLAAFDDWAGRVQGVADIVRAIPPGTTAPPDSVSSSPGP